MFAHDKNADKIKICKFYLHVRNEDIRSSVESSQ